MKTYSSKYIFLAVLLGAMSVATISIFAQVVDGTPIVAEEVVDPKAIFSGSKDMKLVSKAEAYMASSTALDAIEATKTVLDDERNDKIINRLDVIIRLLDKIEQK